MATELKGEWSLTSVTKSGVTSQTASYKVKGKEVIKLTNLSPSLKVDETNKTIDGLTVDEDNKTVTLSGSALNKATVAFTSSTYTLELDGVSAVEFTDIQPTVASGKITFKSPLSEGYTLSANGKTLTYSEAKTEPQEIATVSGLATTVTAEDVSLDDGAITLSAAALKQGAASLTLKNGATYTLAIGSDVDTIETTGTWSYDRGKATLKGTVDTAGYAVSADGKKVNYIAATKAGTTATLATVSGLGEDFGSNAVATDVDETGNFVITLPASSLNKVAVSVSGNGYVLALDGDVVTSENAEKRDEWTVNKATATYNQIMPEHYDVVGGKVAYTKEATVQTYAKVTGLKSSGLEASSDKKSIQSNSTEVVTVSGSKVITLKQGALDKGVTLTSDDYSLKLDNNVTKPAINTESGTWSLSGKTGGVYKAPITTAGWGLKDAKTVTYTATSNSAIVGTITGLKSGITVADLNDKENGIKVDTTESGTFTISKDLLTNTDVTLVNGNGFGYKLATDADTPQNAHSWEVADVESGETATAKLYYGKSAYYTASSDGNTLTYKEPVPGTSVATIQFLKAGTKAEDLPTAETIKSTKTGNAKNYTISLSEDVLTTKTVTLTGTGYELALDKDLSAKDNQLLWDYVDNKKNDTTATLINYKTEGWAPNTAKTQIVYTAPVKGATLATVKGFKSGLKQIADGTYDEVGTAKTRVYNNFIGGIVVYTEKATEDVTGSKTGEKRNYAANTIAIEKSAVNGGIEMTSSGYSLAVGKDLTNSTATEDWAVDATKATYTYQTPAGYSVEKTGTTSTLNVEKASKLTATITGLTATTEAAVEAGVEVDNVDKTITLSSSVLGTNDVTIKGNYTLAVDSSVKTPTLGTPTWDMSKKGTATLKGAYATAGYTLDDKKTTLTFTKANDGTKTLATVSGLKTTAGQTDTSGLSVNGTTITLSSDVLNKAKVTIKNEKGSEYKLALDASDEDIPTKVEDVTEWVVKGTNANYQSYTKGYYSMEKTKAGVETGAIAYTKDTSAKVKATVSGVAKDTDADAINANYNEETGTLTLKASQLGTAAKITLTNKTVDGGVASNVKLALASDVPTKYEEDVSEWSTSGTTATYKNFTKGFYTKSSDTLITYTKDTNVKTLLTITGLVKDSQITSSNFNETAKTITLTSEQLVQNKDKAVVTLKDSTTEGGYKLKLASGLQTPSVAPAWTFDSTKGSATYAQSVVKGDFICNGSTITYYDKPADITLATLTGFSKTAGLQASDFNGGGAKVSSDGVITLTDAVLKKDAANSSKKVSVSTKGYTLALDSSLDPKTEDIGWDFKTALKKSGTATFKNKLGAGYILDAKGTSVSYSAAKDENAFITLSGLNKNYSGNVDNLTAAAAGITVDDTAKTVTLSNADLLTTSKITLKNGTGANYTLTVDKDALGEKPLGPETAVWSLKGTTATLSTGTSAYYEQDSKSKTTVNYNKEVANTPVATLTNLGKNAKVDGGKLGTLTNKVFTQGVFIRQDTSDTEGKTYTVVVAPEVLGTTDVTLADAQGSTYKYKLSDESLTAPDEGEKIWAYDANKGTATLTQTVVAGWTLNDTTNTLNYTAGKDNAALTTFSGLSKTFSGDLNEALDMPTTDKTGIITVKDPTLLGTSKATLKNATGYTYTLALDSTKIPTTNDLQTKQWLTSGAKASLKDYNRAYYTPDANGTSITYTAAKDAAGRVYAEVNGIKKDVDISSRVSGNVITLGADQLDAKNVTLTNKTVGTDTSKFTLALGSDAQKATLNESATWTVKSGTATLTGKVSPGYTASSDGLKLTYAKNPTTPAIATIKGVKDGVFTGEYNTSNTTFTLGADSLTSVVTIDGKEIFDFKFSKGYDSAKITGAATADTINAAGDKLNINTGNGNDVVTVSGANVSITAGAGDDTISISGGNASINAGAGNDSIKSGGGNNVFYYATGNGNDTITGFAATDKIMTNAQAKVIDAKSSNGNAVITIGAGTKTASTITLTGKAVSSISIVDTKGNAITPSYAASSDVLLADDNYSMDAAAVTDITDAFHASYTPYDFESGLDLVKKDSFTPVVSYTGDDK